MSSYRSDARARRRAARAIDARLGVENARIRCTCGVSIAGDHIDVGGCNRHGVGSFLVTECCYCEGDCHCGWSRLDAKQLAYVRYIYS